MSYTEIFKFNKEGNAEEIANVKNAFRGAMAVWMELEKRYLPKFKPAWALTDNNDYSRTSDVFGGSIKEIWALQKDTRLSDTDKIALMSTFDNAIVLAANIPELIKAFNEFDGNTSLKEQAVIIEAALKEDPELLGIAWNQTSVNGDAWQSDEVGVDEDGEEFYPPYNILKEDKHWSIFA